MNKRNKYLTEISEIAKITLAARALESLKAQPRIQDELAVTVYQDLEINPKLQFFTSNEGCIARSLIIDRLIKKWMEEKTEGIIINLGAGLDYRSVRLAHDGFTWLNIDRPGIIKLRQIYIKNPPRSYDLIGDIFDMDWQRVKESYPSPNYLFIAEGVLMYFAEADNIRLYENLGQTFPGAHLIVDYISDKFVNHERYHQTVKNTKAKFLYGMRTGKVLEDQISNLTCLADYSVMEEMAKYSLIGQLMKVFMKSYNQLVTYLEFK